MLTHLSVKRSKGLTELLMRALVAGYLFLPPHQTSNRTGHVMLCYYWEGSRCGLDLISPDCLRRYQSPTHHTRAHVHTTCIHAYIGIHLCIHAHKTTCACTHTHTTCIHIQYMNAHAHTHPHTYTTWCINTHIHWLQKVFRPLNSFHTWLWCRFNFNWIDLPFLQINLQSITHNEWTFLKMKNEKL